MEKCGDIDTEGNTHPSRTDVTQEIRTFHARFEAQMAHPYATDVVYTALFLKHSKFIVAISISFPASDNIFGTVTTG